MTDSRDSRREAAPEQGRLLRFRKTSSVPPPPGPGDLGDGAAADLSAADLLAILWDAIADILGTAAAATLLRRAARRAEPGWPELGALSITRDNLEYCYAVPPAWTNPTADPPHALRELVRELWPLLVELTGSIVVNRLAQIPELRERGIVPEAGAS